MSISSIVAHTDYCGLAAYGATKSAMEGLTQSLARDVGLRGITVNAVALGFLTTEMTAGARPSSIRSPGERHAPASSA